MLACKYPEIENLFFSFRVKTIKFNSNFRYASNPAEHDHYYKYYTDYYVAQITNGHYNNLPTMSQIGETANSGAAVAMSAIQRKQKQQSKANTSQQSQPVVAQPLQIPTGLDNKKYRKFFFVRQHFRWCPFC